MKTLAVSLEKIASWFALRDAWLLYRSGKRRRGDVASFELNADRSLLHLSRELLGGFYRHCPYRLMRIHDPKPRLIAVAPVRDRIVHTAIHHALSPGFDISFIHDTYACLTGRGSHRAVLRFLKFQREFKYLVHLDIHRYYPSVDHGVLLSLLEFRLRDPRVMELLMQILQSGWELYRKPGVRDFFALPSLSSEMKPHGLPIGNLTSQWWGNLYLNGMDHFIKRKLKARGFIRYMDDFVCFADDRVSLKLWRSEIRDWLKENRGLALNPGKGHIRPASLPQSYLGHRITRQGYDLGPKALKRFRKSMTTLTEQNEKEIRRSIAAWRGVMCW